MIVWSDQGGDYDSWAADVKDQSWNYTRFMTVSCVVLCMFAGVYQVLYWTEHYLRGGWSFLPPPNFPMCQNPEKNRVLNWPPSEMTKSRTCHPKKMEESPILVTLGVASSGKFGSGKKDQPPCIILLTPCVNLLSTYQSTQVPFANLYISCDRTSSLQVYSRP